MPPLRTATGRAAWAFGCAALKRTGRLLHRRGAGAGDGRADRFFAKLLEQRAHLDRPSRLAVRQRRYRPVVHAVDGPIDDRRTILAGRAPLALSPSRPYRAGVAAGT